MRATGGAAASAASLPSSESEIRIPPGAGAESSMSRSRSRLGTPVLRYSRTGLHLPDRFLLLFQHRAIRQPDDTAVGRSVDADFGPVGGEERQEPLELHAGRRDQGRVELLPGVGGILQRTEIEFFQTLPDVAHIGVRERVSECDLLHAGLFPCGLESAPGTDDGRPYSTPISARRWPQASRTLFVSLSRPGEACSPCWPLETISSSGT